MAKTINLPRGHVSGHRRGIPQFHTVSKPNGKVLTRLGSGTSIELRNVSVRLAADLVTNQGMNMNKKSRNVKVLKLENLEGRQLMAANVIASLDARGTLYVEGTDGADSIRVEDTQRGIVVTKNGNSFTPVAGPYDRNAVQAVRVNLLSGNDSLRPIQC
jgi:hypothetical protein